MAWHTPVDRNGEPVAFARDYRSAPRTAVAAGGSITAWTPQTGRRIRLCSLHLTASAATVLTVRLGANLVLERDLPGAGGVDIVFPPSGVLGPVGGALTVSSSAAVTVGATATGAEE